MIGIIGYYSLVSFTLSPFALGLPETAAPELRDAEFPASRHEPRQHFSYPYTRASRLARSHAGRAHRTRNPSCGRASTLYDRPTSRYLLDEFLADVRGGHDVRATVIVQARSMLRAGVPAAEQPLGETVFANGVAAMSASASYDKPRI
nr:hypothetical protein [Variovorax paradoxus]